MSSTTNLLTQVDGYRGNATLSTALYSTEERMVRKSGYAQASFLDTM